ncbi:MAG TPA: glycosyl hydrolase 115 family protein [Caulobacterales bacterium]|nr:glycosyl hydrolase 115 family protein [Caulobacterales bacterium]
MRQLILVFALVFGLAAPAAAQCLGAATVCPGAASGHDMALIEAGRPVTVYADGGDFPGVLRAAHDLADDLGQVAGADARLSTSRPNGRRVVIVGVIGHSALIDRLVRARKLDVTGVTGHWEAFVQQVVDNPMPGVERALVIAGADKRGAIFGLYDLSARIGVSPWTWWADVPVRQQANLYVTAGRRVDEPRVRYRGIFLNDEDPALKGWATEKFGGLNHQFYEHVFNLILRLRGNYLWPAMWGKSLWDDDPQSADLADEMGVVLGTSHHEPLQRSHVEWERYGHGGAWDYTTNARALREFWREGMVRRGSHETIVTIGMRGDGDRPMTQGTAIQLLEQIVHDQRQIIEETTHRPASETPQLWALYKEVQDYYDQGMRVPDDVTLLFSDDNWGNIRRLPTLGAAPRAGGYGIYYHFDYVGGPRNYKWINTNQIERVWEQMHLARAYGADRIWIVNVGDLKPMEFPISFFLDYAWNPEACDLECLRTYPSRWAAQQFGPEHADEIGELLTRYTQYNARRKPELIDPSTFSVVNFGESERVVADWSVLAQRAERIGAALPAADHDAYFQLVLYPILASANLNEMYDAAARNRLFAQQGRDSAGFWGSWAQYLFHRDAELAVQYHALGGGRWNHQMDQTHIGYTTWQQPDRNIMPAIAPAARVQSTFGVAIEGDARVWLDTRAPTVLPELSPFGPQKRMIFAFQRTGSPPFARDATASARAPWLHIESVDEAVPLGPDSSFPIDMHFNVSVDWSAAPPGRTRVPIVIRGQDARPITVYADVFNPPNREAIDGFVEANGYVSMQAMHYARAVNGGGVTWAQIPNLGPAAGAVTAFPVTAPAQTPGGDGARLEYEMHLFNAGDVQVQVTAAPSLDFRGHNGLRYAVSIDDGAPHVVDMAADQSQAAWNAWVAHNENTQSVTVHVAAPGHHTLKLWLIDAGVVFERIIVATRPLPPSYLGPPESMQASQIRQPARR